MIRLLSNDQPHDPNLKVFIYWNLTRNVWSVKALTGPNKGRVIYHKNEISLVNCEFRVSEKQRQSILKNKRKVVHAGVVGYITNEDNITNETPITVTYNPYKYSSFVNRSDTSQPIHKATYVRMNNNRSVEAYL